MQYNINMDGNLYEMQESKRESSLSGFLAFIGIAAGIVLIYAAAVILR